MDTIRINLVDYTTSMKHVDFLVVPVTNEIDFACVPEGILPLRAVIRLSRDLKDGTTFGRSGKYLWYRLIGAPDGTYKCPMNYRHRRGEAFLIAKLADKAYGLPHDAPLPLGL